MLGPCCSRRLSPSSFRSIPAHPCALAAAELDRNETPVKVVLQEAVHLAERYGTTRSARFVNGVLDAYARMLGRL